MESLKENYEHALLGAAALALAAVAGWMIVSARSFSDAFADLRNPPARNDKIPAFDAAAYATAKTRLAGKQDWEPRRLEGGREIPLFVSVPYISKVELKDGKTVESLVDPARGTEALHPPVPNAWLLANKLPLLDPRVLQDDPDGDGFTNLDEFLGKTDPNDKASHPPYLTKLFLKRFIQKPFRLMFVARVGETVQINMIDRDAPTQFLKVGSAISGTKFKIVDFKPIEEMDTAVGIKRDRSEVTLENTETSERIVLVKEKEVNSPDSLALLTYVWEGRDMQLKKNDEFTLKPENIKYRLIDVTQAGATIVDVTKPEAKINVPPMPAAAAR